MKKKINEKQQPDAEKLNQEIEEELLYYLENGRIPHDQNEQDEQEIDNYSFQTVFQFAMTIVLVLIVILNVALIIYKLFR
ncbi:MAG TPA: hypothetical protein VIG73_01180 [Cerasibacillus sp.]|uniref:hypothetical protein n=1 Tax=Cerasibacillus sp. TaxID=2498711 RepID=UPI002F3F0A97